MQYNFSNFKAELKKVEEFLGKEYRELNVGRASPMVLDSVMVESYDSFVPLKNVASVSVEDPKTLRITVWDKTQVKGIEKAIAGANLGLSVIVDDAGLRVIFPQLTTESRQNLVKMLKEKLEESRITVRQERESVIRNIEATAMTEDETFNAKEELQKIISGANAALEATFEKKEREIMG
ncbi:MAG TPA: ribosome-recycling factor [Candidatus Paceibacterota bacterium]|nr:ribosome-recycling factor [Candidatus Paceibacterota bacterium]